MKFRVSLALIGLGVSIASLAVTQGCGGEEEKEDGDQTGKVPPRAEGMPAPASPERTFAVNAIALSDTDRAGTKNKDAWRSYGYNLDGRITNVTDRNSPDLAKVCKISQGSTRATIHQDGEQGIDNVFGKEVLKSFEAVTTTPSRSVTDSVQAGAFTIMLKLVGLTDDPAQTNTGLSGTLFVGGPFHTDRSIRPQFVTTETWPYLRDPQVPLSGAYINKGFFVNGKGGGQVQLSLSFAGQALNLTIQRAVITFRHNPVAKTLEDGTIAGVVRTEELVSGIDRIAGSFGFCEGATVEGLKSQIRGMSDMLADGTQDPNRPCDGMSIGIGFTAKQIGNPTVEAIPGPPPGDPCSPDAGSDAQ